MVVRFVAAVVCVVFLSAAAEAYDPQDWVTSDRGASPASWYTEMKRVRKYARIAIEDGLPAPEELGIQANALRQMIDEQWFQDKDNGDCRLLSGLVLLAATASAAELDRAQLAIDASKAPMDGCFRAFVSASGS